MLRRELALSAAILLLEFTRAAAAPREGAPWDGVAPQDAESRLAAGLKLRLSDAELWEMELVPGLSETVARRVVEARQEIAARCEGGATLSQALRIVRGVGEKTAAKLAAAFEQQACRSGKNTTKH